MINTIIYKAKINKLIKSYNKLGSKKGRKLIITKNAKKE